MHAPQGDALGVTRCARAFKHLVGTSSTCVGRHRTDVPIEVVGLTKGASGTFYEVGDIVLEEVG